MPDDDRNKPLMPEDDSETYELAEDPDKAPAAKVPPPPGVSLPRQATPPTGDDKPADTPTVKRPDKGPESHFSGDEPAYVNAEVQRMRREEQRIKAAQEEAELAAKRNKLMIMIAAGVVAVLVLGYVLMKVF